MTLRNASCLSIYVWMGSFEWCLIWSACLLRLASEFCGGTVDILSLRWWYSFGVGLLSSVGLIVAMISCEMLGSISNLAMALFLECCRRASGVDGSGGSGPMM